MPKESTRERKTHLECVNKRKVTLRLKENLLHDIPLNMYRHEDLHVSNKLSFIVYIVVSLTGNLAYAVCSKSKYLFW